MKNRLIKLLANSAAIAFVLPSTAFAELSALDVWERWKSFAESSGQTVNVGSQEVNGDTLLLNDLNMTIDFPNGTASSTLKFLEFRERSDGTVAVTMAPDFPFSISVDPETGEAVDIGLIMRQNGASIIASGDPENIAFDYLATQFSLALEKIVVDGVDIDANVQFSLNDIDGKYLLATGDSTIYQSDVGAGALNYNISFIDPEEGGSFELNGTVADLKLNSATEFPPGLDLSDAAAVFSEDVSAQGGFSSGPVETFLSIDNGADSLSVVATEQSSALDFNIANGTMQYGGSAADIQYVVQAARLPFPEVTLGFSEIAFSVQMPLGKSDTAQDFGFLVKLAGLEISDFIWGIFDPAAILPRDPATLALDISGQMKMLLDIFDPDLADDLGGEIPAELYNLSINDVTLSAVGAEITGTGEFTFDNSDLVTFEGFPAPSGSINMDIIGINGLLDKLIQMGFVQQDQAVGARMMLGLFARPGGAEDTLTSSIEIKGDGSVFANGQQIR